MLKKPQNTTESNLNGVQKRAKKGLKKGLFWGLSFSEIVMSLNDARNFNFWKNVIFFDRKKWKNTFFWHEKNVFFLVKKILEKSGHHCWWEIEILEGGEKKWSKSGSPQKKLVKILIFRERFFQNWPKNVIFWPFSETPFLRFFQNGVELIILKSLDVVDDDFLGKSGNRDISIFWKKGPKKGSKNGFKNGFSKVAKKLSFLEIFGHFEKSLEPPGRFFWKNRVFSAKTLV